MTRYLAATGMLALAALLAEPVIYAGQALAADIGYPNYPDELRGAFPSDWDMSDEGDPLGFEAGLRYWYAVGEQTYEVGGDELSNSHTAHILEGHVRIDDYSTNTFLKANGGLAIALDGDYTTPSGSGSIVDGTLGYAGVDFGGYWFGDPVNGVGLGGFVGYQYMNDSPDMGRANFTTASSSADINWPSDTSDYWSVGYDSEPNAIYINALRLGIAARTELADFVDLTAEVAAIPYAHVSGTLGAYEVPSFGFDPTYIQSSAASIEGWGYGAAAEAFLGLHPTDNLTVRLGARAKYLQGTYDSTYSMAAITEPVDSEPDGTYETGPSLSNQDYIATDNPFTMWRLGGLAEITYSF